jgi:hypothetical protein
VFGWGNTVNDVFVEIACPVCGGFDFRTIVEITPNEFLSKGRKEYYKMRCDITSKNFMPLEHINFFTPKSLDMMVKKYSFARIPAGKMVQSIENFPQLFFPLAKRYYRGFIQQVDLKFIWLKLQNSFYQQAYFRTVGWD